MSKNLKFKIHINNTLITEEGQGNEENDIRKKQEALYAEYQCPPVQKFSCKKKNPLPSPYKEGKKKILNPEVYFADDDGNIGDHSAIDSPGPITGTSKQ